MAGAYRSFQKRAQRALPGKLLLAAGVIVLSLVALPTDSWAQNCITCAKKDCTDTEQTIVQDHQEGRQAIKQHMAQAFQKHEKWWEDVFWKQLLLPAMMKMTTQLTSVGIYQMMGIGMQFDAKEHLETQQLLQKMQARAYREYSPSVEFCSVGSNTRSLAASSEKTRHNVVALGEMALERQLGPVGSVSATQGGDIRHRWDKFINTYCDETDNGFQATASGGGSSLGYDTGLKQVCNTVSDENRLDIDIDYRRQIEEPLTINADFTDGDKTTGEEDLIALARNLYGHKVLLRNTPALTDLSGARKYMALRSVAAKRAVAENSFYNIAGLKMAGSDPDDAGDRKMTKETMAAVLKQLGMPEDEIPNFIGEKPSIYAQLEILAKKIFESTDFFVSLYDKPENVERRKTAMAGIGLMIDRAIYESRLRQEMLSSVLVSARLEPEVRRIEAVTLQDKPGR